MTTADIELPRRIVTERKYLLSLVHGSPGISVIPDPHNLRYYRIVIKGPEGSPFEGGVFRLELFLPEDYPMSAPKVRFITKIYHPNIDKLGRIWLDIIDCWTPALHACTVVVLIEESLKNPTHNTLQANDVVELWKINEQEAIRNAREWTKMYALGN